MGEKPERIQAIVQLDGERWLSFTNPVRVVVAYSPADVPLALDEVERLTRDAGVHAVGYLAYEAAEAFDLAVWPAADREPLVWFAFFEAKDVQTRGRPSADALYRLGEVRPSLNLSQFQEAFDVIKTYVSGGDTYQVNFTFPMTATFEGDALALFADLVEAQGGAHSVFIATGRRSICSASPELFFSLDGLAVRARPMKGTARRGRTTAEDQQQRDALQRSLKERAENVMVVDMMRNDLGRIATIGSVAVQELCATERYPSVWQMTSLVTARSTASLREVFAALHPPASVTGAPKVRTMEIIRELERGPRGIYTGAIGHVSPDGSAGFSVAIRTAMVDESAGTVEFGVGSGVVWDSDASAEYDECLLKGGVLGHPRGPFELLETLRWTPGEGFFLLDRHLARLLDSADYFDIPRQVQAIRAALEAAVTGFAVPHRVRLLVARDGSVRVETAPLVASGETLTVRLAAGPVDTTSIWLFHKTTRRRAYDEARGATDADDVLLWNTERQITEATTANVVVQRGGERVTPPIACGLLGGTFRAELLARQQIREATVTIEELASCDAIWLINSVHEWRSARLLVGPELASGVPE